MKYGHLVIEKKEFETLKRIIGSIPNRLDSSYRISLQTFGEELQSAILLDEDEMPDDVVRFNSTVTILDSFSDERTYSIVMPSKADVSQKMISILAPMGLALFGYSLDDKIEWQFPTGKHLFKIIKVEQCQKKIIQSEKK